MEIIIREFTPNDLEILRELNREVFLSDKENIGDLDLSWPDSETGQRYYEEVLNRKNGKVGFVAEHHDKAIGYMVLSFRDLNFRKSKFVEIENIGVTPDFRSKGIGGKLLKHAEDWARSQGTDKLLVETFAQNNRGIDFYHKFGFTESAVTLEKNI